MSDLTSRVWFPEPSRPDPTWARRREPIAAWIRRSTVSRAVAVRAVLNENLACLLFEFQQSLVPRLEHEWASAYFELVVACALQQLGATLMVEEPTATGKRPDFLAQFPDGLVTVEAVSPVVDADINEKDRRTAPLLDEIEEAAPDGWWVVVEELPTIGLSEPRRWFRQLVRRMMDVAVPGTEAQAVTLVEETRSGRLRITLWPRTDGGRGIGAEHMRGGWDDTEARILSALDRKRRQVRAAETPVLLAINAPGLVSNLENFDRTLFGRSVEEFDIHGRSVGTSFRFDGALSRPPNRGGPPTYAGVLAFRSEGLHADDPVLYVHPRLMEKLPTAFLSLEVRTLGRNPDGVRIQAASRKGVLECLSISN